jgi:hypothetical protein
VFCACGMCLIMFGALGLLTYGVYVLFLCFVLVKGSKVVDVWYIIILYYNTHTYTYTIILYIINYILYSSHSLTIPSPHLIFLNSSSSIP